MLGDGGGYRQTPMTFWRPLLNRIYVFFVLQYQTPPWGFGINSNFVNLHQFVFFFFCQPSIQVLVDNLRIQEGTNHLC